ncbi:MAG TPA: DUF814 domain-containing protein [Planctomycetes bacterium]|nr:DUF814 domain-containing protein [Planctomycetota bacterium]
MVHARELDLHCRVLAPLLVGRRLRNLGVQGGSLDLWLFFEGGEPGNLRVVVGDPSRARLLSEPCTLHKEDWIQGGVARTLNQELEKATLESLKAIPGERRVLLGFDGRKSLVCELFGPRGNWFLLDEEDRILASAFRPRGGRADLVPGALYSPPSVPALVETEALPLPEDPQSWLRAQQERAQALEEERVYRRLVQVLRTGLERERRALQKRIEGLGKRRDAEQGADLLQREAELLLAQKDQHRRGLREIEVQDWYDQGKPRTILLDPKHDLGANAKKKFARAKSLREGRERTKAEMKQSEVKLDEVTRLLSELRANEENAEGSPAATRLANLRKLQERAAPLLPGRSQKSKKSAAPSPRLPYRLFRSRDGLDILVGRGRRDNDKLSKGIARGRDLWLHIGGGYAGSHVVLRLQKDQAPPSESLLDAATLAVHFSKARGKDPAEVLYTKASQVRKRKGAPPGLVEVLRHKTLLLRFEEDRLQRLLATLAEEGRGGSGKG